MMLLFTLHHSNKENEPTPLLDHNRKSCVNPYVTRKKVPTRHSLAFSQAPSSSSRGPTLSKASTSMASNPSLSTIEEDETSPAIRRILEKTRCSSRQELLAMRAAQEQQVNTNGSRNPNASKSMNGSKTLNGVNSSISTNGSKAAPNVAKNGAKSASKGSTNPKKKAKSKHFY